MYNCIIFDIDGTLVDTEKAIVLSLQKAIQEVEDKTVGYDEIMNIMGIPADEGLETLGVKETERVRLKWGLYYKDFNQEVKVFDEMFEVLEALQKFGIITGLVTAKTRRQFDRDFVPFGISHYFPYAVCADEASRSKPYPDPILKILALSGADPSKSIYIGDTLHDMNAAKSAGIHSALALWGAYRKDVPATLYLQKPADILKLVDKS